MNYNYPRVPQLDGLVKQASGIGDGFVKAGMMLGNYGQDKIDNKLKRDVFDADQNKNNDLIAGYADAFSIANPDNELVKQYKTNPNIMTQNKLGNFAMAHSKLPKDSYEYIDGKDYKYRVNKTDGSYEKTDMPVYRDPFKNMSSTEKEFGNMYGFGTQEYNNAMRNYTDKKQMVTYRDDFGNIVSAFPSQVNNRSTPQIKQKKTVVTKNTSVNNKNLTPAQQKVVQEIESKKIENDQKRVDLKEDQYKQKDEVVNMKSSIKSLGSTIKEIDDLINNKDLDYATGVYSYIGGVPATQARDIHAQVKYFQDDAFMKGIEQMKGMGALSDAEGKKIADSIANLDMGQSTEAVRSQLKKLKRYFQEAREKANQKLRIRGVNNKAEQARKRQEVIKILGY